MSTRQRVGISEIRVARAPAILVTYGLGSCLGIVLYDADRRLGGLAHTLLPQMRPGMAENRESKFVDRAIELMIDELVRQGADRDSITAKICGGANMFEPLQPSTTAGIGERNAQAARERLEALGIELLAEDVGGNHGRTVEFDLDNGEVRVRSVCHAEANIVL